MEIKMSDATKKSVVIGGIVFIATICLVMGLGENFVVAFGSSLLAGLAAYAISLPI